MYFEGKGVPQYFVLSHMWLNLAATQGFDDADDERDDVADEMSHEQIAEAQKLAIEWKPK
jgi:TPR repeat protein